MYYDREGKPMKTEVMLEMLDAIKKLIELRESIEKIEEKQERECPLHEEMGKEYRDILDWALGKDFLISTKGESKEIWKSLHPDLPYPRVFLTNIETPEENTIGLLLDIIPLYHEDKKRKCKCDNAS